MRGHDLQDLAAGRPGGAERAGQPGRPDATVRRVAALAFLIAGSLAVASALHLSGQVHGRSAPFDAAHAGIAEALIGAVLAGAAVALRRRGVRGRRAALWVLGFAVLGFCWGLSMTAQGGDWPDIAYHLTVLPLLAGSFVALLRSPPEDRAA
jgi:peptidoglycan/LPS O-acetylase OafA/YrhL